MSLEELIKKLRNAGEAWENPGKKCLLEAADTLWQKETEIEQLQTERDVYREELISAKEKLDTLQRLLNGEWVDTQDVEAALGITFREGLKRFEFSREASWNPWPLNGQRITTKFRLKEEKKNEP